MESNIRSSDQNLRNTLQLNQPTIWHENYYSYQFPKKFELSNNSRTTMFSRVYLSSLPLK